MQLHYKTKTEVIKAALYFVTENKTTGKPLSSPKKVRDFLTIKLAGLEHEVFACLFLDNKNKVIEFVEMFRGTIDGASVYPREVVKEALKHNAAVVIFAHNHPSGDPSPSDADIAITGRLKDALSLVDIRVNDHFIIGKKIVSFAEKGLL